MTKRQIVMKRGHLKALLPTLALLFGLFVAAPPAHAEEGSALLSSGAGVSDQASLQRGAHLFFNYCVGCHSLRYMRYSRMAEDLGLSKAEVMENLDFTGGKFQGPVISHMPAEGAKNWFGKDPPDLSLEVSAKGADWVYTYLNSFYLDPNSPIGWNNLVLPNAAMPFPLWKLQGMQTAVMKAGGEGEVKHLKLTTPGTMTPEQFHQATRDLTSFLAYVSEPAALQRHHYGIWVILFLAFFTLMAYLLKKEYWKDVH